MKNTTLLFLTLFSFSLSQAQIVNIPDADFKTGLLNYQPAIDTNHDNEIQVSEALAITDLNFGTGNYFTNYPQNIIGIEAFTNLTNLSFSYTNITTIDISSLINLQHFNCPSNYTLTSLNVSGLSSLLSLDFSSCYNLTSVDLSSLSSLQLLNCSNCNHLNSLNFTGLSALTDINCGGCYDMTSLTLNSLPNLIHLNCSYNYHLTSLDLSGLPNLQTLNCSNLSYLSTLDLTGLAHLTTVNCSLCMMLSSIITTGANNIVDLNCESNALTSLDVSGMTNLHTLNCGYQDVNTSGGISSLDLTGLNFITSLNCSSNNLTSLSVSHLTNLTYLNCNYNHIPTLNVTPLVNLTSLSCGGNSLTTLDLSTLVHLTNLDCHYNSLNALNIDTLTALTNIDCGQNHIPSLNVSNNTALTFLACANNLLTTLDIASLASLTDLICSSNQLTTMDFSNSHHLTRIEVGANLFETLDFSQPIIGSTLGNYFHYSIFGNPNLTYVNLKNGTTGSFYPGAFNGSNCPNLQYICADEDKIQAIQQSLIDLIDNLPTTVQVNSYCTFVPGGIHNTITGTVTLDNNNNGCDAGDIHPANFKININDGTLTGATFSLPTGGYSFFTQTGSFTLTPQFENNYFIVSPTTATLNFADLDASTQTQNFCITANGIHNDVDIVVYPIGNARPGFDANYILIYKNKGNQVLSGTINLAFDDAVLDFVSANPTLNGQSLNNLNWNYSNLLPFESRTIYFTLNVNSPIETPAINIDDVLNYVATINPISGDETTDDNTFTYNQTVRGAFDPNDKICLEGNSIIPERVGDYLHYIIDFQNTGSAPAENIVVRDDIDATKFDISSFELTASSHPQVTRITGNKVEFVFENINLPAQIDNEPASHGYVAFKIKTKSNLVLGNTVSNTANIYFDYNFPIITNTTSTTVSTLGIHDFENATVSISPNPVKNTLSILADDVITSIQLFDVQGRLITTKLNASLQASLDLSQQQTGVYFVKVYTDNGMKVQKVIKQ